MAGLLLDGDASKARSRGQGRSLEGGAYLPGRLTRRCRRAGSRRRGSFLLAWLRWVEMGGGKFERGLAGVER